MASGRRHLAPSSANVSDLSQTNLVERLAICSMDRNSSRGAHLSSLIWTAASFTLGAHVILPVSRTFELEQRQRFNLGAGGALAQRAMAGGGALDHRQSGARSGRDARRTAGAAPGASTRAQPPIVGGSPTVPL